MRISVEEARRLGILVDDESKRGVPAGRRRKSIAPDRNGRQVRVGETVEVVIEGAHVPKERGRSGRTRNGRTVVYTSKRTRAYEAMVGNLGAAAMHGRRPIEGPVLVEIGATLPVPASWPEVLRRAALAGLVLPTGRPDLDNSEKSALDALNNVVYRDDAIISRKLSEKAYGASRRLVIRVTRLAEIGSSEWRQMKASERRALLARLEAILDEGADLDTIRG